MAKSTTSTPKRSAFLREFLQRHPKANLQATREAWAAAGNKGTISSALFYSIRPKRNAATSPAPVGATSRSEFIRSFLTKNPAAPFTDIQRAYQAAGHPDALNIGLYYSAKSAMRKHGTRRPTTSTSNTAKPDDMAAHYVSIESSLDQLIQQAEVLKDRSLGDDLRHARRRAAVALIRS